MRILVLGATGQIALALRHAGTRAHLDVVTRGRPGVDITRAETVARAITEIGPDLVVNAAAYTAVDAAETDSAQAYAVNAEGAAKAAAEVAKAGLPLLHLSTDYVFDGRQSAPYSETDMPAPCNVYGASKLAGEIAVRAAHPAATVLRTAWIYSGHGRNFLLTMLNLARSRQEIAVVDDQTGCPTFADDAADGILALAAAIVREPTRGDGSTLHIASPDYATRFELAREIFSLSKSLGGPVAQVMPVKTIQFPTPAVRPLNSRLSSEKLLAAYGLRLPAWRDGLARCMSTLAREGWSLV